jgi:prepilin-type N-terminal cleavage/methylation domain-containing protein
MNKRRRQVTVPACGPGQNSERGFTLIEILVAMGILAAVGIAFLGGMITSSKATRIEHMQVTAEGLAKSQLEYIKNQDYRVDMEYEVLDPAQIPNGYSIDILGEYMNPRGDSTHNDDGLQKITISIARDGETVLTMEGYKRFVGQ